MPLARITRIKFVLIVGVILAVCTVQVLPQVDLPDTAFHEDEAPTVANFRQVVPVPVIVSPKLAMQAAPLAVKVEPMLEYLSITWHQIVPKSLPILLSTLLC